MWNKPSSEELSKIPALYSSEGISLKEKMIYMHFFIGGCDLCCAQHKSHYVA